MTDHTTTSLPQPQSLKDVDRIRDIVFGGQMREYAGRFANIQRDLDRLQAEIDQLTESLTDQGRDFDKRLQQVKRDTRQSDDDIRAELRATSEKLTDEKVDRLALGELFIELGNHLKAGGSLADVLKSLSQIEQG